MSIRAVLLARLVLGLAAAAQLVVFLASGSIALLADLIGPPHALPPPGAAAGQAANRRRRS